jgi:hypothetical protein
MANIYHEVIKAKAAGYIIGEATAVVGLGVGRNGTNGWRDGL